MQSNEPQTDSPSPDCPKCGGPMELGFIADHTYAATFQSMWSAGEPRKSFWGGIKLKEMLTVDTYRCTDCGYLESYAVHKFGEPR
jgi:hypothetical protein